MTENTAPNTPNLRTLNFQYAALKRVADVVKEGMAYIKDQHLEALQTDSQQSSARQWTVDVDDTKVATVTLAGGTSSPRVANEAKLLDWAAEHRPDMVELRPRLTPQAAATLKAIVVDYIDGEAITEEGEVIPGVVEAISSEYQSVRWTSTKQTNGKNVMDDFLAELGIAGLIEDVAAQGKEGDQK